MIKRNPTKPVRVVPPMMEEQEVSTITYRNGSTEKKPSLIFYSAKEKKKASTNLTKVSKTAPFSIRHSANVNSVPLN